MNRYTVVDTRTGNTPADLDEVTFMVASFSLKDGEDISDGYHTFTELYDHRRALSAVLAFGAGLAGEAWRSKLHHPDDDPMFDGYFIVGIELPTGLISYHYELKYWDDFPRVPILEHAKKWDGHTAADVVDRLLALVKEASDGQG